MTMPPEPLQVLRARVLTALRQAPGVTADELATRLDIDGPSSIPRQIRRALQQLEHRGQARREIARCRCGGRTCLWRPS